MATHKTVFKKNDVGVADYLVDYEKLFNKLNINGKL